jgi:hypothetical protein
MNQIWAAVERCEQIRPVAVGEFLGGLLDQDPEQLAQLPGTPAMVLSAQFCSYLKSSVQLSDVLRRGPSAQQVIDAVWRATPAEQEKRHDPDSCANKRCRACAA